MFSPMLTPENAIDTIQQYKKNLTDRVYTDPTLNKAAQNFIAAQTQFAKMLVTNTVDISKWALDQWALKK